MICNRCKKYDLGNCSTYGNLKTDREVKVSLYSCFEEKIYHVDETSGSIKPDDQVYYEEMSESEIRDRLGYCRVVKKMNEKKVNAN